MLKKLIGLFSMILMAVIYALNIKPKKQSESMAEKSLASFDNLSIDDKLSVLQRNVKCK